MTEYDRIVVVTDEQSHDRVSAPKGRGYMVNVASAKNGVGYGAWSHIDSWSEAVIEYIRELERRRHISSDELENTPARLRRFTRPQLQASLSRPKVGHWAEAVRNSLLLSPPPSSLQDRLPWPGNVEKPIW